MTRTHLLDTSVYSQPVKRTRHPAVAAHWELLDPASAVISAVCEAEILYGLKKRGSLQMRETYDSILSGRFQVIPVDGDVAATYANLRCTCEQRGVTVESMDLLIAATAMTHGLTVATLKYSDFSRIPGLAVEDGSRPSSPKKEPEASGEEAS